MIKVIKTEKTASDAEYQELSIKIESDNGVCTPDDLQDIQIPDLDFSKGVVIEGRAPIWVYCYLAHACHPSTWLGTYDPRLGIIICSTHNPDMKVGDILK